MITVALACIGAGAIAALLTYAILARDITPRDTEPRHRCSLGHGPP